MKIITGALVLSALLAVSACSSDETTATASPVATATTAAPATFSPPPAPVPARTSLTGKQLAEAAGCTGPAPRPTLSAEEASLGVTEEVTCTLNGTAAGIAVYKDAASAKAGVQVIKAFASLLPTGTYYLAVGPYWIAFDDTQTPTKSKSVAEAFVQANGGTLDSYKGGS